MFKSKEEDLDCLPCSPRKRFLFERRRRPPVRVLVKTLTLLTRLQRRYGDVIGWFRLARAASSTYRLLCLPKELERQRLEMSASVGGKQKTLLADFDANAVMELRSKLRKTTPDHKKFNSLPASPVKSALNQSDAPSSDSKVKKTSKRVGMLRIEASIHPRRVLLAPNVNANYSI
jgi:hypothetical protein